MKPPDDPLDALERERAHLARLEEEMALSRERLRALEAATRNQIDSSDVPTTPGEKVALFRSLFRGREDVFPRRWENAFGVRAGLRVRTTKASTVMGVSIGKVALHRHDDCARHQPVSVTILPAA